MKLLPSIITLILILQCTSTNSEVQSNEFQRDPDVDRSIEEEILSKGYSIETKLINTSDGYVLKIFRILGKKENSFLFRETSKQAVLLMHGLGDSSDSWVSNSEDLSVAYQLSNKGFDVWLGNNRGNKHSKEHNDPKIDDKTYWNFSFHEMGLFDLPAIIDTIISVTSNSKIIYVGHSQGCSQFFALCSLKPEYCVKNVKGMVALGPAIYLDHSGSNLVSVSAKAKLDKILQFVGINKVLESPESVNVFTRYICLYATWACNLADKLIADLNPKDNNQDRIEVFFSHYPSGMSLKSLHHFAQIIRTKKFTRLDNDEEYPIINLKVPMHLFIGHDDLLANPTDSLILKDKLSSTNVIKYYHEYEGMGHMSFFMTNGKNTFIQDFINQIDEINKS